MRDVLTAQPGFSWLDAESGWFWLENVRRNRLLNVVNKVLAVAPPVDVTELRAGIARYYRMEGFAPPKRVLLALCDQLEDCEVVGGRVIVDRRPRLPVEELSHHEQTMLAVFREYGPVLSFANARQLCIDAGLNETTTSIYLGTSAILRRVTVGVYTVIGATVSPGAVEKVAKANRRSKVIQDYGWEPDLSAVWATYELSTGTLRNGVVGMPAGIKKYITKDSYALHGLDGTKVGRIGIGATSMWGFVSFFRRRGGEAGDYMRVSFNLSDGTARAEISGEAFSEDE